MTHSEIDAAAPFDCLDQVVTVDLWISDPDGVMLTIFVESKLYHEHDISLLSFMFYACYGTQAAEVAPFLAC